MGRKVGIGGARSSLIGEVFRLLGTADVPWVVLENVPFLMSLAQGAALRLITTTLTERGYRWAYRVVDSNAFGLPQRRNRWYLVASRDGDPRDVLLVDDTEKPLPASEYPDVACGFYWTEGMRAFGWAVDGVPPIKCGSSVGVASPPAIRMPTGRYVTPDLRDAERLQGFPVDWTASAEEVAKAGERWRLVGNSVSVPAAAWIGRRLAIPGRYAAATTRRGRGPSGRAEPRGRTSTVSCIRRRRPVARVARARATGELPRVPRAAVVSARRVGFPAANGKGHAAVSPRLHRRTVRLRRTGRLGRVAGPPCGERPRRRHDPNRSAAVSACRRRTRTPPRVARTLRR